MYIVWHYECIVYRQKYNYCKNALQYRDIILRPHCPLIHGMHVAVNLVLFFHNFLSVSVWITIFLTSVTDKQKIPFDTCVPWFIIKININDSQFHQICSSLLSLFVLQPLFSTAKPQPSSSAFIILPSHQVRDMKRRSPESNLPLTGGAGCRAKNLHLIHINYTHTNIQSHTHTHATYMLMCMHHLASYNLSKTVRQSGGHLEAPLEVARTQTHTNTLWQCKSIAGFVLNSRWPGRYSMSFKT